MVRYLILFCTNLFDYICFNYLHELNNRKFSSSISDLTIIKFYMQLTWLWRKLFIKIQTILIQDVDILFLTCSRISRESYSSLQIFEMKRFIIFSINSFPDKGVQEYTKEDPIYLKNNKNNTEIILADGVELKFPHSDSLDVVVVEKKGRKYTVSLYLLIFEISINSIFLQENSPCIGWRYL